MIRRIVVPLDGSQISHAALPLARGLASQTGASVTLLSVMNPPRDFYIVPQGTSQTRLRPRDVERLADEENRLQGYLNQMASTFRDASVEIDVRLGNPAEEILDDAESVRDSVVVMASHGRSGLGRALLGSVASRVVQAASVPVFLIRASDDSKDEYGATGVNQIVVPLDGSRIAEQALATVRGDFRTSVDYVLVRVIEPVAPGQAYAPETIDEYDRQARRGAEDYLSKIAEQLPDEGATVSYRVRAEAAAAGITDAADEVEADLIAMTTHGRTGIGRFLLGSVAERVLHQSNRPVMVVKAAETDEGQGDEEAPPLV